MNKFGDGFHLSNVNIKIDLSIGNNKREIARQCLEQTFSLKHNFCRYCFSVLQAMFL